MGKEIPDAKSCGSCHLQDSGACENCKIAQVGNPIVKDTNPKDSCGVRKVPFSTLSMPVIAEMGLSMMEGALKYGRHNYRVAGVRASVYFDAAMRHLSQWWEGEDVDPESGISHVVKAMAGLMVLRDAFLQGKLTDDRPPVSAEWIKESNTAASKLVDKYPDPKPAHTKAKDTCTCHVFALPHAPNIYCARGQYGK